MNFSIDVDAVHLQIRGRIANSKTINFYCWFVAIKLMIYIIRFDTRIVNKYRFK